MKQKRFRQRLLKAGTLLLLLTLALTGCSDGTASDGTREASMRTQSNGKASEGSPLLPEESEVRAGAHEHTLATPSDFPESYDYGSGRYTDWDYSQSSRRLPEPEGNETVRNTAPDLTKIQALYLWEEGNFPARTEAAGANFDPVDFRPYLTSIPVREGTEVKGAVILLAGGAFQARANYTDTLPTAAHLRELGYQTIIVDYRLKKHWLS